MPLTLRHGFRLMRLPLLRYVKICADTRWRYTILPLAITLSVTRCHYIIATDYASLMRLTARH